MELEKAALEAWYEWRDGLGEDDTVAADSHWLVLERLLTVECPICHGTGEDDRIEGPCGECAGFTRLPRPELQREGTL